MNNKLKQLKIRPILMILLIGLCIIIYYFKDNLKFPGKIIQEPKWITISYSDLIDDKAIIRTGDNLKSAYMIPTSRGAVQPFLAPYSFLFQHSIRDAFWAR